MFNKEELTLISIAIFDSLDRENDCLNDSKDNLEYELSRENSKYIQDFKDDIEIHQNRINKLEELQVKVAMYKMGVK